MSKFLSNLKLRALVWLIGAILLSAAASFLVHSSSLNASVLALLPKESLSALPPEIEDGFVKRLDKQVIFLVSLKDADAFSRKEADALAGNCQDLYSAAQNFTQDLEALGIFSHVQGKMDDSALAEYGRALFKHRSAFIDAKLRSELQHGGEDRAALVLQTLFSPFSGLSVSELTNDPLLLMRSYQEGMLKASASSLGLKNGFLTASYQGTDYVFIRAELKEGGFSLTAGAQAIEDIRRICSKYEKSGAQILYRGTVFYSYEAAQAAESDIKLLGSATILLVFLLIFAAFKSVLPLALVLLSCTGGAILAFFVTFLVFESVHVMTLVLSLSIVGISVDYSLYYLTSHLASPQSETALESLRKVQKPLISALMATSLAYLALCAAPFPGIRQMAVFALAGLIGAFLTVYLCHPLLSSKLKKRPLPCKKLIAAYLSIFDSKVRKIMLYGILIAAAAAGLIKADYEDDVKNFQSTPAHLVQMDALVSRITGQSADQKWLALHASSQEDLLQRLERIRAGLDAAVNDGRLKGYQTLKLNSQKTQESDLKLLSQAMPALEGLLASQGLSAPLSPYPNTVLKLNDFLKSPLAAGFELLYLEAGGEHALLISLNEPKDLPALYQTLQKTDPELLLIDRKAGFDALFTHLRTVVLSVICAALVLILGLFTLKNGPKEALRSAAPSFISVGIALAIPALLGFTLNFFNVLALIAVLGMGINYALFFRNDLSSAFESAFAVTLAMLTTLLTLGILVFSSTAAISAFGLSLTCGLACAFILAPTVKNPQRSAGRTEISSSAALTLDNGKRL